MNRLSETFEKHHQELARTLDRHVSALAQGSAEADVPALAAFLQNELIPLAKSEEAHLYTAVEPLVKAHGEATATMSIGHEFIGAYARRFAEEAEDWRKAGPEDRKAMEGRLRYLALHVEAMFSLHLRKEEQVYLPLIEAHLSEAEKERLLDAMHEAETQGGADETSVSGAEAEDTLDVRSTEPRHRHPRIFGAFEVLKPGESFVLVNDHDPKPLYYQFQAERGEQFEWDYLEQGPEVWRVRIGRTAA